MPKRIAVIGFGFSGLMVIANLARRAAEGTLIYIIAPDLRAQGMAYSTENTHHLLNVPAAKMGAFADDIEGLQKWLATADAALAKQKLNLTKEYAPTDFVPRALYAAYLQSIWRDTQEIAAQHKLEIKLVETTVTAIQRGTELAVLTERGDAIAVDDIVLATGNEVKPILTHLPPEKLIQNPWMKNTFDDAANWSSPVMLMGTGLTAIDVILSLRSHGYKDEIITFSRNGLMPQPHQPAKQIFNVEKDSLPTSPATLLQHLRSKIRGQGGEWRVVIDALRPHTQTIWQRFSLRDQQRFFRRLQTLWSTHRHRMAPEIAAAITQEIASGTVRIIDSKSTRAEMKDEKLTVTLNGEKLHPSRIVNCTGPQLNIAKSSSNLLVQAVADGIIEPHANGIGITADPQLRAWGQAYPHLYAIGGLLTGQLLESTAVPELRTQATQIAQQLTT